MTMGTISTTSIAASPADAGYWSGLFDYLEPDLVGTLLGTGMLSFGSPFGVSGLVRPDRNKLEILAVASNIERKGYFRLFIEQCKARCNEVYVWEDWNPVIGEALSRYGFSRVTQREADGETLTGWAWKSPTAQGSGAESVTNKCGDTKEQKI